MSQVPCAKCGEPWEVWDGRKVDMKPGEARQFHRGEGCPSCGFGTVCAFCEGTGLVGDGLSSFACCLSGRVVAFVPLDPTPNYKVGEYYTGYLPNVSHLPKPGNPKFIEAFESKDGRAERFWVTCPTCAGKGAHLKACSRCSGTGKPVSIQDQEFKAAYAAIEATDQDPVQVLVDRGLL